MKQIEILTQIIHKTLTSMVPKLHNISQTSPKQIANFQNKFNHFFLIAFANDISICSYIISTCTQASILYSQQCASTGTFVNIHLTWSWVETKKKIVYLLKISLNRRLSSVNRKLQEYSSRSMRKFNFLCLHFFVRFSRGKL